jgi:DNA-binding NtrC family response regulator
MSLDIAASLGASSKQTGDSGMLRTPKVLLLSASAAETEQIQQALGNYVHLTLLNEPSRLEEMLDAQQFDALFCAWALPRSTWSDVLEDVREWHPDLPVIILASGPEVRQWAEVLEAGAFDLLVPPYEDRAVLATLEQASSSQQGWNAHRDEAALKLRA